MLVNLHFLPGSETLAENVMYGSIALIIGFVIYGFITHNSEEFGRTVVLMILILSTVVFWALFEQSAGSMTLYADRVVDRTVGNIEFTASQFGSLNAGFIMTLALPFAALWPTPTHATPVCADATSSTGATGPTSRRPWPPSSVRSRSTPP